MIFGLQFPLPFGLGKILPLEGLFQAFPISLGAALLPSFGTGDHKSCFTFAVPSRLRGTGYADFLAWRWLIRK